MGYRVGIDLGGTKIEGVVLDADGIERERLRVATEAEAGYAAILDRVVALVDHLLDGLDSAASVGIGAPGALSARTGFIKNSNTQCLNGRDLRGDLEGRLGRPVAMDNDANCFALAEACYGAARGHRVVFGVIMGTGVGGGIVIDGKVHRGPQAIAGEWGHHSIDPAGPECYCGHRGCVETYLSGPSFQRAFASASGRTDSAAAIVEMARGGDPVAEAALERYLDRFGRALANLIDVLDPDAVVLGGGMSNIDELYSGGLERIAEYVFSDELVTPVLRHELGDSAGVIGAALLGASAD